MTTTKTKRQAAAPAAPPGNNGFSLISEAKLLQLYARLLNCRMIEEQMRRFLKSGRLPAGYRSNLGREAPAVGVAIDLLPEDTLTVCHGGLSASYVKGMPLSRLYASPRSSVPRAGNARSAACSAPLNDAVQSAATAKSEKSRRVAVVLCGAPGGKSPTQASWREAMRRAGAEKLPIVFVRHSDSASQGRSLKTERYGFPGIVVDGNDVVAIYRVASEAIAHARRGNGPTLIECRFARMKGVRTSRGKPAGDPIGNLESYLSGKSLFTARLKAEVAARFKRKLRRAQGVYPPRAGAHG